MVFLLIFVYKITTNPSVVKCTKPNKKMYKITKSGFVRSFTFLTPFSMPFAKENHTIYIEGKAYLLPCFWKGRLSSFRGTKASGHADNGGDTPAALRQAVPFRPTAGQFCRISVVSCPVSSAACRTGCLPARSKFPTRTSFCHAHRCTSTRPADNKMKSASSRPKAKNLQTVQ